MNKEILRWDQRINWASTEPASKLVVGAMKEEIIELRYALADQPLSETQKAIADSAVADVLSELRADISELQNNLEAFGEYSQETARVALDGALDALDECAERHASSQSTEVVSLDDLAALLPGPYYMDPPDGGSVHVMEQLRRMSEDAAKFCGIDESSVLVLDGWISVKDRLPEIGTEVIVYCPNKEKEGRRVTSLCRLIRYEDATDFYWGNYYGGNNIHLQNSITHWQSLPSAPQKEGSEVEE